jgi:hypothetical protein
LARVDVISVGVSLGLLLVIIELIRRRALAERYALLWLLTGVVLTFLAVWKPGLGLLSSTLGIYYPPSALLVVGLGFILLILLHYSVIITKLADHNRLLAQRYAILTWRVAEMEQRLGDGHSRSRPAEQVKM